VANKRKIIIGFVLLTIILNIVACSGNSKQSNEPKKATWIEPQVVGDIVSIPLSEVENSKMTHFKLVTMGGDIAFMAYGLDGEMHVRSNVCPPCWSVGFSLKKDTLVCDTCLTTFKAKTGNGVDGACVDFPKASVSYELIDGNIIMAGDDLIAAHQNTLIPGLP